jgi:hypothetical protein
MDLEKYMAAGLGLKEGEWRLEKVSRMTHLLSHRKIQAGIWKIQLEDGKRIDKNNTFEIPVDALGKYAVPRLLEKYLEEKENYGS